jgi:signal transduction histidine kinase
VRRVKLVLEHLRRAAAAYAVLLLALVLTFLAYDYVRRNVAVAAEDRFDETVRTARDVIEGEMVSYVDSMLGARALFYASDSVNSEEWSGYASGIDLENRYEGIQVLGYAERVEPDEKDAFEEDLGSSYRDEEPRDGFSLRPGGERDVSFPIKYLEPVNYVNKSLLGYDAYTRPAHRAAMDRARDTGRPEATGRVFLFTEAPLDSKADVALEPGLVVYLPVYGKGEPTETVAERQDALDGFVTFYLAADDLLRNIFEEPYEPSIDFEVYDDGGFTPSNLLYDDDGVLRAGEAQASPTGDIIGTIGETLGLPIGRSRSSTELSYSDEINVAGREWGVYFQALPEFQTGGESRLPLFVLLSGLVVSLALFGTTYMLVRSRVRAEKAGEDLEHANRELEATNRELEAFSYSVSHDLRAPLRSIDGFSQIILEDYADGFDEEGRDYLGRVRAASQRMGRLIDDLLGLSRVTRGDMERRRVDLGALASEVAEELREASSELKVEFSAQKGLEVWGDPRLLRVALVNLIGNAWKFTEKEPEARVEFGQDENLSRRGRVPVYYVRDNGAGFDMSYADKLFGAFQRLHGEDEFEGTGIGLATVQRAVHRHGGRIWAEGQVGRGAAFYFTLRPGLRFDPESSREEAKAK